MMSSFLLKKLPWTHTQFSDARSAPRTGQFGLPISTNRQILFVYQPKHFPALRKSSGEYLDSSKGADDFICPGHSLNIQTISNNQICLWLFSKNQPGLLLLMPQNLMSKSCRNTWKRQRSLQHQLQEPLKPILQFSAGTSELVIHCIQ